MSDHLKSIAPELAQASKFYGVFSEVARDLGVSPQHVRQVFYGLHSSKRVTAALERALAKRRRLVEERAA